MNKRRDGEIIAAIRDGKKCDDVAALFGLSPERVRQIMRRANVEKEREARLYQEGLTSKLLLPIKVRGVLNRYFGHDEWTAKDLNGVHERKLRTINGCGDVAIEVINTWLQNIGMKLTPKRPRPPWKRTIVIEPDDVRRIEALQRQYAMTHLSFEDFLTAIVSEELKKLREGAGPA